MARARFVWDDPFLLDEQLSEEERLVRDAAHEYCQERLMSRVLLSPQVLRRSASTAVMKCSSSTAANIR